MTNIDTGITGAKRQSWAHDNPRAVLLTLMKQNPKWSETRIFEAFFDEVVNNEKYVKVILEYWFAHNFLSLTGKRKSRQPLSTNTESASTVSNKIKERIQEEAQVLLLELTMPNGRRLADCTGADCRWLAKNVGAWLLRIAERIKPTDVVGRVLTEKQVRNLYAATR